METAAHSRDSNDEQYLLLLAIFHYVMAGFMSLNVMVLLLQLFLFNQIYDMGTQPPNVPDVRLLMSIFILISVGMLLMVTILELIAARSIQTRSRHKLCIVVAGINCLFMPLGTILGVFTLIVLLRPSVQTMFEPG